MLTTHYYGTAWTIVRAVSATGQISLRDSKSPVSPSVFPMFRWLGAISL